jgi:imidazolonepropionase-like amidohydrolase
VIRHATVLTAAGKRFDDGTVVVKDGLIAAVGDASVAAPDGAQVIDATGEFLTPGVIDTHSHVGVFGLPATDANDDGNETSGDMTPRVDVSFGYWAQDPAIGHALAHGVTTAEILPGSSNLIGGRGMIVEMRPGPDAASVMFAGAPRTLKMACGENPKRTHGDKGGPVTRMGEYAELRGEWQKALEYRAKKKQYAADRALWEKKRARAQELDAKSEGGKKIDPEKAPDPIDDDPDLDVLADVLDGKILVQIHCYRTDDMLEELAIADKYGYQIRSFHHALEAYKIRDVLARRGIAINTWSDWWGFKMEALDGIMDNAAFFTEAGGRATIHSDSPSGMQHLNQEAAKAYYTGLADGVALTEDQALRWITANPAWVLGIDQLTGTIETGKRADLVLWDKHPFSVYARPQQVFIRGQVLFDRKKGETPTDFELGEGALP